MSLSNREAIYLFRKFQESRSGKLSDDSFNAPYPILEYLRGVRATVVKQYLQAGIELPVQMYQTISCLKLKDTDLNDCPTQPRSGCSWLKSTHVLPSYIQLTNVSAGLVGSNQTYDPTNWDKITFKLDSKVPGNIYTTKDTGEGTHVYLYSKEKPLFLDSVSVTGIFENPVEAMLLCDKDCECEVLDQSFYADRNIFNVILEKAWSTLSQVQSVARVNRKNDGNSED